MRVQGEEKIVFVIGGLRTGGAEKVCVALVNEFFRRGHNVSLIVLNLDNADLQKHLDLNIPVFNLKVSHTRSVLSPIKKVLKDIRPTICLSFNFQLSVQLVLLKRLTGLKYRLYSRGINTFSQKISKETSLRHKYLNAFLIKRFYKNSDYFIAQSSGMKSDMISSLGVPEHKIKVIFNPVFSFASKSALPTEEKEIMREHKEILFVGSLKEQKNVSFLLKAIKELKTLRLDFIFRIVGDGQLRASLEKLVTELDLLNHVRFEGFSNNTRRYYKDADLFVLGSWYEGFPNVIIEALSYGVPTVSINCMSGPSDIIVNDKNGFLVDNYDEHDFAFRMNKALTKDWDKGVINESIEKFGFDRIFKEYENYLING